MVWKPGPNCSNLGPTPALPHPPHLYHLPMCSLRSLPTAIKEQVEKDEICTTPGCVIAGKPRPSTPPTALPEAKGHWGRGGRPWPCRLAGLQWVEKAGSAPVCHIHKPGPPRPSHLLRSLSSPNPRVSSAFTERKATQMNILNQVSSQEFVLKLGALRCYLQI